MQKLINDTKYLFPLAKQLYINKIHSNQITQKDFLKLEFYNNSKNLVSKIRLIETIFEDNQYQDSNLQNIKKFIDFALKNIDLIKSNTTKFIKKSSGLFDSFFQEENMNLYTVDGKKLGQRNLISFLKKFIKALISGIKLTIFPTSYTGQNLINSLKDLSNSIGNGDFIDFGEMLRSFSFISVVVSSILFIIITTLTIKFYSYVIKLIKFIYNIISFPFKLFIKGLKWLIHRIKTTGPK